MFGDNFVSIRFNLFKGVSKGKIVKALEQILDETGVTITKTKSLLIKKNTETKDVEMFSFANNGIVTNEGIATAIMKTINSNSKYLNYRCVTIDVEFKKDLLDKFNNPISVIIIEESKKINNNNMKISYCYGSMFTGLFNTTLKETKEERVFLGLNMNFKKNSQYFDSIRNIKIGITASSINSFTTNSVSYTYIVKGLKEIILKNDLKIKAINSVQLSKNNTYKITKHDYKKYNLNNIFDIANLITTIINKHKEVDCTGITLNVDIETPIFDYEGTPVSIVIAQLSNYSKDKADAKAIKTKMMYASIHENNGKVYETQVEPIVSIDLFSKSGLPVELIEAVLYNLDDSGLKIDELKYVTFYKMFPELNGQKIDPIKSTVAFGEKLTIEEIARKINTGVFSNMYVSKNFVQLYIKPTKPFLDKYSNTISHIVIKIDEDLNADVDLYFGYSVERPTLLK